MERTQETGAASKFRLCRESQPAATQISSKGTPLKCAWEDAILQVRVSFKGLVHPKMKMMSLITHPHVVPTP